MSEGSQFSLLGERRFGPFFAVQFLGAFHDNVFKQALVSREGMRAHVEKRKPRWQER